ADAVDDAKNGRPFRLHLANGRKRVGRFTRLADGDCERSLFDDRVAIPQLAGVVDVGGNPGKLFKQIFADEGRMPGRAAAEEQHAPAARELTFAALEAAELSLARLQ